MWIILELEWTQNIKKFNIFNVFIKFNDLILRSQFKDHCIIEDILKTNRGREGQGTDYLFFVSIINIMYAVISVMRVILPLVKLKLNCSTFDMLKIVRISDT